MKRIRTALRALRSTAAAALALARLRSTSRLLPYLDDSSLWVMYFPYWVLSLRCSRDPAVIDALLLHLLDHRERVMQWAAAAVTQHAAELHRSGDRLSVVLRAAQRTDERAHIATLLWAALYQAEPETLWPATKAMLEVATEAGFAREQLVRNALQFVTRIGDGEPFSTSDLTRMLRELPQALAGQSFGRRYRANTPTELEREWRRVLLQLTDRLAWRLLSGHASIAEGVAAYNELGLFVLEHSESQATNAVADALERLREALPADALGS